MRASGGGKGQQASGEDSRQMPVVRFGRRSAGGNSVTQENRKFYLPFEFSSAFRLSLTLVYRMIRHGEIKAVRVRKQLRIPKAEYCRFCMGNGGCEVCVWGGGK